MMVLSGLYLLGGSVHGPGSKLSSAAVVGLTLAFLGLATGLTDARPQNFLDLDMALPLTAGQADFIFAEITGNDRSLPAIVSARSHDLSPSDKSINVGFAGLWLHLLCSFVDPIITWLLSRLKSFEVNPLFCPLWFWNSRFGQTYKVKRIVDWRPVLPSMDSPKTTIFTQNTLGLPVFEIFKILFSLVVQLNCLWENFKWVAKRLQAFAHPASKIGHFSIKRPVVLI